MSEVCVTGNLNADLILHALGDFPAWGTEVITDQMSWHLYVPAGALTPAREKEWEHYAKLQSTATHASVKQASPWRIIHTLLSWIWFPMLRPRR